MSKKKLQTLITRIGKPYSHNGSAMSQQAARDQRDSDVRTLLLFIGERLLREMETGCPMASDGP